MISWKDVRKFFSINTAEEIVKRNLRVALKKLQLDGDDLLEGLLFKVLIILGDPSKGVYELRQAFGEKFEAYEELMQLFRDVKSRLRAIADKL